MYELTKKTSSPFYHNGALPAFTIISMQRSRAQRSSIIRERPGHCSQNKSGKYGTQTMNKILYVEIYKVFWFRVKM